MKLGSLPGRPYRPYASHWPGSGDGWPSEFFPDGQFHSLQKSAFLLQGYPRSICATEPQSPTSARPGGSSRGRPSPSRGSPGPQQTLPRSTRWTVACSALPCRPTVALNAYRPLRHLFIALSIARPPPPTPPRSSGGAIAGAVGREPVFAGKATCKPEGLARLRKTTGRQRILGPTAVCCILPADAAFRSAG